MAATVRSRSGRTLSEADLDRLADRAERGLDLGSWKPRRGRPSLDPEAGARSPRIAVRVPDALRRRAVARAASEGKSMSEVVRDLLESYVEGRARRAPP
jgi:predicted HicB family RNase H-like nuclease